MLPYMTIRDHMLPYTYTLIIKTEDSLKDVDEIEKLVLNKLHASREEINPIVARISNGEALVRCHTLDDSSRYGIKLADWFGEMPFNAPFPSGTLLWYV